MIEVNKIYTGDCLSILKGWPGNLVDCVVTSSPYWGLRAYGTNPQIWDGEPGCEHNWNDDIVPGEKSGKPGPNATVGARFAQDDVRRREPTNTCGRCGAWRGELGLEPTFNLYINHLIQIFTEVKRVLKPTGTCWVNLGDSYSGSGKGIGSDHGKAVFTDADIPKTNHGDVPAKSLCCIPDRFKIAMVDAGWVCRNEIIWYKRNCMPSSASDRFTVDFEKIYFFTKQGKYWFEQQFEPAGDWGTRDRTNMRGGTEDPKLKHHGLENCNSAETGRNMRCVWDITTKGYKEAHFATFPPELPERIIKAGCPKEICKKCGKAREKIYKEGKLITSGPNKMAIKKQVGLSVNHEKDPYGDMPKREKTELGYTDCGCNAGFEPGITLDLFMGSGTTAVAAKKLGRQWLGIELNEKYIEMANRRIENTVVNGVLDI